MTYSNMDNVPTQTAGTSELLASDWNTYVRDNFDSIKFGHVVVADATARTNLGNVAEGVMVYQSDNNKVYVNSNGTTANWVEVSDLDNTGGASDVVQSYLNAYGVASRNRIINSNFTVWQRAFSASNYITVNTTSGKFGPDRWAVQFDGTMGNNSLNRESFTLGQTTVPGEPQYFLRWDITSAGSASTYRELFQKIEGVRTFAGQTVTLSFWAKADTNRTVTLTLRQYFGTGGSPSADVNTSLTSCSVTNSWQKFTRTVTLPSISGKTIGSNNNDYLMLLFGVPVNVVMQLDISQVQLEASDVATPFEFEPYETTLRKCQRYYIKVASGAADINFGGGILYTATALYGFIFLPVAMRAAPTNDSNSGTDYFVFARNGGTDTFSSLTLYAPAQPGGNIVRVENGAAEISGTAGQSGMLATNSANAIVAFTAEL